MGEIRKETQIKAGNEQEAKKKAYEIFSEEIEVEFAQSDINVELIEEKKKLFGLLGKTKTYQANLVVDDNFSDGDFKIKVKEDGIFLWVKQPEGGGKEITMDMIEEVIEDKKIIDVDYNAMTEALTVDEQEIKIAERRPELDRDAKIEVKISGDEMTAKIDYTPALGGKSYTAEEIIELVKAEGVSYGISEAEFKEVYQVDQPLESLIIAQGREPVPGEDAKIEFEVDFEQKDSNVNIDEDGKADFYNLNRIINVEPEDVLATKIPPQAGEPGMTVTGTEIETDPVVDMELPLGENVKASEDGDKVIADMEGQVVLTEKKISVLDVHTVKGDVDLSTGNVEFNGNVVVKGSVTEGMEVKSGGNVEVHGSVYKANIEAEGNIIIKKGFIGSNTGLLKAKGSISVKFIENGTVEVEEGLVVKDAIMHSDIDSGKEVIVNTNKGLIVGGKVRAAEKIEVKTIGSNLATATEIYVGVTPELRDEFRKIDDDFKELQKELDMAIKDITLLKKKKEKGGGLAPKRQQLLNQLTRKRFKLANELEGMKNNRNKLAKQINKSESGKVRVKDKIFSGVTITIGNSIEKIDKPKEYIEFYVRDGEIKSSSYE